jgi:hydrogenase maturation protein HypF
MIGKRIRVRGLVQGVGFRPYVWTLAKSLGLKGWVRNDGGGVSIAVRGNGVATFLEQLPRSIPRLARIDAIEVSDDGDGDGDDFVIIDSLADTVSTAIGPDTAPCPQCAADICEPGNRRWRYAFTTCTHCGPRFTVTRRIPYDRSQTSLAPFALCPACAQEYRSVTDRRFHAQTTCCPDCGPRLQLCNLVGRSIEGDPIAETLHRLQSGGIVAIKGLGGFHLVCDARNAQAVAQLRLRKAREEKPLAVMALNAASVASFAQVGAHELALLNSPESPIVLCRKAAGDLPGIAPGLAWLGVMLPSTPLQLLFWHEACGRPSGTTWMHDAHELLLVMSSANPQGEPLVCDNEEALQRLSGIADAVLMHNRDIVVRCDDSVLRAGPAFIRRARGYTPVPIALAQDGPTVLALGGNLKNTVCVMAGRHAYLSQHIGGLDNAVSIEFLEEATTHLLRILDVQPSCVAHDLHPDFASTHLALDLAARWGVAPMAVAHHHAHIAAICAEHGLQGPLLGLAIDGAGLGTDGGWWGGELLRLEAHTAVRLGHLRTLALPGGDRAAREPWRMAVSALHGLGRSTDVLAWLQRRFPQRDAGPLLAMLDRQLHCPPSSSMGRLFDAAAGLLGLRDQLHFEGQAAMELEGLAQQFGVVPPLPNGFALEGDQLSFSPLLATLADCDDMGYGASVFHATVAAGLQQWLEDAAQRIQLRRVAIGGGCAMNEVLMGYLRVSLAGAGLSLLEARKAPPNDGGLALGQAWVARAECSFR